MTRQAALRIKRRHVIGGLAGLGAAGATGYVSLIRQAEPALAASMELEGDTLELETADGQVDEIELSNNSIIEIQFVNFSRSSESDYFEISIYVEYNGDRELLVDSENLEYSEFDDEWPHGSFSGELLELGILPKEINENNLFGADYEELEPDVEAGESSKTTTVTFHLEVEAPEEDLTVEEDVDIDIVVTDADAEAQSGGEIELDGEGEEAKSLDE